MTTPPIPNASEEELARAYCTGNTPGEPYSEYEGHFYIAGLRKGKELGNKKGAEAPGDSTGKSSLLSQSEKQFRMKQDDWIEACQEIDSLTAQLSAANALLAEREEAWREDTKLREAHHARSFERANAEREKYIKLFHDARDERNALEAERDQYKALFEVEKKACDLNIEDVKRLREALEKALTLTSSEAIRKVIREALAPVPKAEKDGEGK